MKRTILIVSVAAIAAFIVLACWPGGSKASAEPKPAAATEVKIDNFTFNPATITVPAGTTVHWTNHDDIPHNVVAEDKTFKSEAMDTNEGFSFTFSKAGTYSYFCSIHPKMTGKVVVQ
jgi:plastocyanin